MYIIKGIKKWVKVTALVWKEKFCYAQTLENGHFLTQINTWTFLSI